MTATDDDLTRDMVGDVGALDITMAARGTDCIEPRYDPADSNGGGVILLMACAVLLTTGAVAGFMMAVAVMQ